MVTQLKKLLKESNFDDEKNREFMNNAAGYIKKYNICLNDTKNVMILTNKITQNIINKFTCINQYIGDSKKDNGYAGIQNEMYLNDDEIRHLKDGINMIQNRIVNNDKLDNKINKTIKKWENFHENSIHFQKEIITLRDGKNFSIINYKAILSCACALTALVGYQYNSKKQNNSNNNTNSIANTQTVARGTAVTGTILFGFYKYHGNQKKAYQQKVEKIREQFRKIQDDGDNIKMEMDNYTNMREVLSIDGDMNIKVDEAVKGGKVDVQNIMDLRRDFKEFHETTKKIIETINQIRKPNK